MEQTIVEFLPGEPVVDEASQNVWLAVLACGHRQHVRHKPPWQLRPWVATAEGRQKHVGAALDCPYCDMPTLPSGVEVYGGTRSFDQDTIPAALLQNHVTKKGTWGRIVVASGKLRYAIAATSTEAERSWVLSPHAPGIIAPASEHRVQALGDVVFKVEFLRVSLE